MHLSKIIEISIKMYFYDQRGNKKIPRDKRKWKHNSPKCMGYSKSSFINKREVYSNKILPQETRKSSNNLTLYLKQLDKEEQIKPKVSRRKEII